MMSLSNAQRREKESGTKLQDVQKQVLNDINSPNYVSPAVIQMLNGNWTFETSEQEILKWNHTITIAKEMVEFNKQKRNYEYWASEVTRIRGVGAIRNERRLNRVIPYSNDIPRLLRSRSITAPPTYEEVAAENPQQIQPQQ